MDQYNKVGDITFREAFVDKILKKTKETKSLTNRTNMRLGHIRIDCWDS